MRVIASAAAGLADVYLIPQLYAAERFNVSLEAYPRIRRVAALAASIRRSSRPIRQSSPIPHNP